MAQSILFWKGKPMLLLPSDNICQSIYCIIWTIHLEGFFFSSVNQLDPHCLFALMFHVWSMLQFILQGLALALQSVLLPAQVGSSHYFCSRLSRWFSNINSHPWCRALCNQWCSVCCVPVTLHTVKSRFWVLLIELPASSVSELCVIHTELAEIHGQSSNTVHGDVGSALWFCTVIFSILIKTWDLRGFL